MSKEKGCPKGEMGFSLFIDKDNKIIFRISGYFVCTPFIVCPSPPSEKCRNGQKHWFLLTINL